MPDFTYERASSRSEAVSSLNREPGAKYLGGGTNLVDLMKMGVERPSHLVDITRVPLTTIAEHNGGVRIGAMARNSDAAIHPLIRNRYPVVSQALLSGASPQTAQYGHDGRQSDAANTLLLLSTTQPIRNATSGRPAPAAPLFTTRTHSSKVLLITFARAVQILAYWQTPKYSQYFLDLT